MESELLALERRRNIFKHISENPGTYLREMEEKLGLSVGDLQYHLGQLEKGGLINSLDDNRRKGYFVSSEVQYFDRELLALMRMKVPRRIIIFILLNPGSTFSEILGQFNFTKGALSFHLKRISKTGILEKGKKERESIYQIKDMDRVMGFLMTYKSKLMDDTLDNVVDLLAKI